MSTINVSNLSFSYDGGYHNIFDNVSFTIDTNWKLGFIGRNGKGKTTFLQLLLGKYEYDGKIITNTKFDYFPFEISDEKLNSNEIAKNYFSGYEQWKLEKEVSLMDINPDVLYRPFYTLSKGEQTKVLLAILFLRENDFLLIDEPTNHLDENARKTVANYLNSKQGFILISHDRKFIDSCVDHILSINKSNIELQHGNFSSWFENKTRQDNFELMQNEILKKDINRLEKSAKQASDWSDKVESSKYNMRNDVFQDKGYIGHKAAKMMKRSISLQNRKQQAVNEKSKLLKNIEVVEKLQIKQIKYKKNRLIEATNISVFYGNNKIFNNVNFYLENGDRLQLKGKNGCGKSSIIKLILGHEIKYIGNIYIPNDLKISYVSQDTSDLHGDLSEFARNNKIDETLFKTLLKKLDFDRILFEKNIENYSEGQKKKVLIAKSLCEEANLYIWDEPLNYVDIFSRIQIEQLLLEYCPTMIFVEHDSDFSDRIATKVLNIDKIN